VLTGLMNRRGMQQALPPLVARSGPRSVLALFVLDLDGFKQVNDTLGHDAGDALLVAVAQRLRAQLRARDLVCRLGGDEFVLAVGDLTDDADAERIGRKLLAAFDAPFEVAGQPCRVGLTIGLALAPQDDTTVGGLLKRADAAMYAGKQAGRHCLRRGQASVGLSGA
jgi:diguanylate cyclase (GGDEF)-like protein